MLLLNACSNRKIVLNDAEQFQLFSLVPNPSKDMEMHSFGNIITDAKTAAFLREWPLEWVRSENKEQILAVQVDADQDVCRDFLRSIIGDNEELLKYE
jgi:hypothetical protein